MQLTDDKLEWLGQFPELLAMEDEAKSLLANKIRIVEAPVGTIGYHEGANCEYYVMRLSGRSRVYKISTSGREILLYRVHAGETCVITTTCLLGNSDYPASTVVEESIKDVLIPSQTFHQLMSMSKIFREYVMKNYGALITDLIVLLDEVAFQTIDARLAKILHDAPGDTITSTHQQLADELGTAREVISRQLKRFEQKGIVALGRGKVEVIDKDALESVFLTD